MGESKNKEENGLGGSVLFVDAAGGIGDPVQASAPRGILKAANEVRNAIRTGRPCSKTEDETASRG